MNIIISRWTFTSLIKNLSSIIRKCVAFTIFQNFHVYYSNISYAVSQTLILFIIFIHNDFYIKFDTKYNIKTCFLVSAVECEISVFDISLLKVNFS